jgi:hypothetical protein
MRENTPSVSATDQPPLRPNPALKAVRIMVGRWDIKDHDSTTNAAIRGQSSFEWLEGGFILIHRSGFDYPGRKLSGVEFTGCDEKSGLLKTHVFSSENPVPLEETWHVDEHSFTNWFGDMGALHQYKGTFSEDRKTLVGQWESPGAAMEQP